MVVITGTKKYLALLMCAGLFPICAQAQNATNTLLETHQKALGTNCQACHEETPPARKVPDAKCIGCHGDRATLGARSKSKPNPHSNHVDELYCSDCHHVHKPSELYCAQCHDNFDLKVP